MTKGSISLLLSIVLLYIRQNYSIKIQKTTVTTTMKRIKLTIIQTNFLVNYTQNIFFFPCNINFFFLKAPQNTRMKLKLVLNIKKFQLNKNNLHCIISVVLTSEITQTIHSIGKNGSNSLHNPTVNIFSLILIRKFSKVLL